MGPQFMAAWVDGDASVGAGAEDVDVTPCTVTGMLAGLVVVDVALGSDAMAIEGPVDDVLVVVETTVLMAEVCELVGEVTPVVRELPVSPADARPDTKRMKMRGRAVRYVMRASGRGTGAVDQPTLFPFYCALFSSLLIFSIAIIATLAPLGLAMPQNGRNAGIPPPPVGDWIIASDEVVADSTVRVNGNVIVRQGQVLTLERSTLEMTGAPLLGAEIHLEQDAVLRLNGTQAVRSAIRLAPDSNPMLLSFHIVAEEGSTLEGTNCSLQNHNATLVANAVSGAMQAPRDYRDAIRSEGSIRLHSCMVDASGGMHVIDGGVDFAQVEAVGGQTTQLLTLDGGTVEIADSRLTAGIAADGTLNLRNTTITGATGISFRNGAATLADSSVDGAHICLQDANGKVILERVQLRNCNQAFSLSGSHVEGDDIQVVAAKAIGSFGIIELYDAASLDLRNGSIESGSEQSIRLSSAANSVTLTNVASEVKPMFPDGGNSYLDVKAAILVTGPAGGEVVARFGQQSHPLGTLAETALYGELLLSHTTPSGEEKWLGTWRIEAGNEAQDLSIPNVPAAPLVVEFSTSSTSGGKFAMGPAFGPLAVGLFSLALATSRLWKR